MTLADLQKKAREKLAKKTGEISLSDEAAALFFVTRDALRKVKDELSGDLSDLLSAMEDVSIDADTDIERIGKGLFELWPAIENQEPFASLIDKALDTLAETKIPVDKATWSTAFINTLPDEAFAYILPGGTKDDDGKTTPRSLRKFPHHGRSVTDPKDDESVDLPHLRNALSRLSLANLTPGQRARALAHLQAHAKNLLPTYQEQAKSRNDFAKAGVPLLDGEESWEFSSKLRSAINDYAKENGGFGPVRDGEYRLWPRYIYADSVVVAALGDRHFMADYKRDMKTGVFAISEPVEVTVRDQFIPVEKAALPTMDGEEMELFRDRLRSAVRDRIEQGDLAPLSIERDGFAPYIGSLYGDRFVVSHGATSYSIQYKRSDKGVFSFSDPVEVEVQPLFEPVKKGERLQVRAAKSFVEKKEGEDDEYFVLGIVLEPNDGVDGPKNPDADEDIYSAVDIRNACHDWMKRGHKLKIQHRDGAVGKMIPVENYIAPVEFEIGEQTVLKGTWLMGVNVTDEDLWKKYKSGEITGWSVGGSAAREPV